MHLHHWLCKINRTTSALHINSLLLYVYFRAVFLNDSQEGISDETMFETSFLQVSGARNCQKLPETNLFMYEIANYRPI